MDFKCYNCGKDFRDNLDLTRHKNRKTPCLIREVAPEQINNPNRCIFCNKVFANVGNKNKHLKLCKVKNGGMDILVDKVKYDQEIRILKEQREQDIRDKDEQLKKLKEENEEKIQKLMEEVDALKKAVTIQQPVQPQQIINNTFNAPINNTVNITINNYMTPNIQGLVITPEEIMSADKISKLILQKLYFNPELPENHCMYLQNKKDKTMILYDSGKWKSVTGENTKNVICDLNNVISGDTGYQLINGKQGPYKGSDNILGNLSPHLINKIVAYNTDNGQKLLLPDDAYEIFLGGRDIVLKTIKEAGCKLI
ncbi:Zinc finger C2H2-type [Pacmanvirus A23]|uniref:Zinc finger C2H2-type n=1 Tax=Pacmanvirus A23 TaxID=1932881 RepID=UPI000A0922DF|nr:Zinc finger C2H2-type [Pacmanvirus A23]SIP85790.1 Zinc finger C2H2-type [Pacmanvirus A23]